MGPARAAVKPTKRRESWDQSYWVVAALGLKAQGISRQPERVSGDISLPLRRYRKTPVAPSRTRFKGGGPS